MTHRLPESDLRADEGLMLAYRYGEAEAFELLYARWRSSLYRYLVHQCGHGRVADELFQDIWLRVVNARNDYEVTAKFSTWLFRIAHNRLVDYWRQSNRNPVELTVSFEDDEEGGCLPDRTDLSPAPVYEQPEQMVERKALARHLVDAVGALPDAQRETFLMAEEGGMTLEEIATTMGVGRETVKSRLRYAMAKLRSELSLWR